MGRRAVDEAERDGAVGRVVERPLAFDEDPVAEPLALFDKPLHGPVEEVADHAVDGDPPAVDHHPRLSRGDEGNVIAGRPAGVAQLERHRHLADRAVGANRQDDPLAGAVAAPEGGLEALRRAAVVDDPDAGDGGRRGELRVVAEERVEPGVELQAGIDRRVEDRVPLVGESAAGRRDPDQQRIGALPAGDGQRLVERPDDRDVPTGDPLPDVASRERGIEDGDDVVPPVADHAEGGLARVRVELALGQDHEPPRHLGSHLASVARAGSRRSRASARQGKR